MGVKNLIFSLQFTHLLKLAGVFLKHPLKMYPTIKATLDCLRIANKLYPKKHHINTKANAFRHALWNMLITKECLTKKNNLNKALDWAKKITDWHETFSPNNALERAMDLHNNAIGRAIIKKMILENWPLSEYNFITILQQELENSKLVTSIQEIEAAKNQLVYLIEDHEK